MGMARIVGDSSDWHIYERVMVCFEIEAAIFDVFVTVNASLLGSISGVRRQIDIFVDARWEEETERRIIFDAKRRKRKIDVNDVEAFDGMMRDVRASRGVIVRANGWTKAACARADENIDIKLMSAEKAEELDHAAMVRTILPNIEAKDEGDSVSGRAVPAPRQRRTDRSGEKPRLGLGMEFIGAILESGRKAYPVPGGVFIRRHSSCRHPWRSESS